MSPTRTISVLLLAMAAPAFPRAAEGGTDYPQSSDREVLVAWLGERTNIAPATVVAVTPQLVVALVGKTQPPTPGGPVRLTLREEVIAAAYVDTVGGRSSLMSMEIQCEERRVRMDERRLYAGANLTGAAEITEPSAAWVRIPEGSIMDEVAQAACNTSYPWPLQVAAAKPPVPATTVVASAAAVTPVAPPIAAAPVPKPEEAPPASPPPAQEQTIAIAEAPAVVAPEAISAPAPAAPILPEPEPIPPPPLAEEFPEQTAAEEPPVTAPEVISAPEPAQPALPESEPAYSPPPAEEIPEQAAIEAPPVTAPDVISAPEPVPPALSEAVTAPEPAAPFLPEIEPEPPPPPPPAEEVQAAAEVPAAPPSASIPAPEVEAPADVPQATPGGPFFAIQIGAYQTEERAQEAWRALSAERPVLIEGLRFDTRPVKVKGRDLLRGLVRDFASPEAAAAFCTALAGTEYGCILRTLTD